MTSMHYDDRYRGNNSVILNSLVLYRSPEEKMKEFSLADMAYAQKYIYLYIYIWLNANKAPHKEEHRIFSIMI